MRGGELVKMSSLRLHVVREMWVVMHQRNGRRLFIPVVSCIIIYVWTERSNKGVIQVKYLFTAYLENVTELTE